MYGVKTRGGQEEGEGVWGKTRGGQDEGQVYGVKTNV